jgi:hypothetical protein
MATINSAGYVDFSISAPSGSVTLNVPYSGTFTVTKRTYHAVLVQGFTPPSTGVDAGVVMLPYATNGSSINWVAKRIDVRSESTGSSLATTIEIQRSTSTGAFTSLGNINNSTISLASGSNEVSTTSVTTINIVSGTKLRTNFTQLNASHGPFFIAVLFEEA